MSDQKISPTSEMKENFYKTGVFFVLHKGSKSLSVSEQRGKFLVAIYENDNPIREVSFSQPFWRTQKNRERFQVLLLDNSFDAFEIEKEVVTEYNDYLAWKEEQKEEEKNDKEAKPIQTSCFITGEKMYEEVYDGMAAHFIYRNGEKFYKCGAVHIDEKTYVPVMDDAVLMNAVLLPTDVGEYETVETLIEEISEHIRTYLDVNPDFLTFASYYVLLSWCYDQLDTIPYLRALGDTGTGKTRFLRVIGGLCYKPIFVAGAITPAPIYRLIKKWGGTIILDEADFRDSSEKGEVITILNCGFSRGTPVIRCEKDNPDNVQILPTYCPKVISTRQSFNDKALESRCLTEIMKQTVRRDLPRILPRGFYESEMSLRNKLLKFRFDFMGKIDTDKIQEIKLGHIEPRLEQATVSFAVLFYTIPELFKKFKSFINKYQKDLIEERANSYDGMIINTLFELIDDEQKEISAQDIVEKIKAEDEKAKISPGTVGKHLKSFKIVTEQKRIENKVRHIIKIDPIQINLLRQRYDPEYWQKNVADVADVAEYMRDSTINNKNNSITSFLPESLNTTATPATPATNIDNVADVVVKSYYKQYQELIFQLTEEEIELEKLLERFESHKIAQEVIDKLLQGGIIFEPRKGWLKKA